ncbi:MAG: hypothetical protein RI964_1893 [Pseudomonadota bacterium]|jgi:thiamine-phosphate pyrophosphorylase
MLDRVAKLRGLYVITDGAVGTALLQKVEQALQGGAAIVQYRDKSTDAPRRYQEASALRALCQQYHALLVVNDDVALAQAVQADGVHVGKDDAALLAARAVLGAAAIIGVSCYNRLDLAVHAQQQGADYVAFGSFFPSPTKPDAPRATLALLVQARQQLPHTPICSIGGITLDNSQALVDAGADMLAVITDVFQQPDITARARQYQARYSTCHSAEYPSHL